MICTLLMCTSHAVVVEPRFCARTLMNMKYLFTQCKAKTEHFLNVEWLKFFSFKLESSMPDAHLSAWKAMDPTLCTKSISSEFHNMLLVHGIIMIHDDVIVYDGMMFRTCLSWRQPYQSLAIQFDLIVVILSARSSQNDLSLSHYGWSAVRPPPGYSVQ